MERKRAERAVPLRTDERGDALCLKARYYKAGGKDFLRSDGFGQNTMAAEVYEL